MTTGDKIKKIREENGMTQDELAIKSGYSSRSTIAKIEKGDRDLPQSKIFRIADALNVSPAELIGGCEQSNIDAVFTDCIRMIPVYESVSAGFGAYAEDQVIDYLPIRIVSEYEANETIAIRVTGDSMYPKIEDGDIVLVHRQDSVDSGDIAVLLVDQEDGLVKQVTYGKTWVELHSLNPEYKTKRFDGAEVQRIRVVGKVKKILKDA